MCVGVNWDCLAISPINWWTPCFTGLDIREDITQHVDKWLGHVLDGESPAHVHSVGGGADYAVSEDPQIFFLGLTIVRW